MANWWDKILGRGPSDLAKESAARLTAAAYQSAQTLPDEAKLRSALARFPGVSDVHTGGDSQTWWVMFHLDLTLPTTLYVIQYLAAEFNNTVTGSFPGAFYPKAPYPGANPDIHTYLNWCIDVWTTEVTPAEVARSLEIEAGQFELKFMGAKRSD